MGRRLLELERQMFEQWHRWREGQISRQDLKICMQPIRQAIAITLQEVNDIGCTKLEKMPWASTVRTCRKILKVEPALWTFLDHPDVEPTNNTAERALRPAVIHRKLSFGVQSQSGALCQSRLLTVTTSLKQHGRDVMAFLVEAWEAYKNGLPSPSLLLQRD